MVGALDCASSGPGSNPGRGHCVVFIVYALRIYSVVRMTKKT